jgi:UDP-N-acetylmuramyl pentapeptide synthase
MKLCIGDLAEIIGGQLVLASLPPLAGPYEPVRRIVVESREIRAGDVYWGLTAPGYDGSHLAEDALLRGAFGVVTSGRRIEPWAGRFSILVPDANRALAELAQCLPQGRRRSRIARDRVSTSTQLVQRMLAGEPVTLPSILARLSENAGQFVA